jgi:cysteine desulfurase / selenocysteine lyase
MGLNLVAWSRGANANLREGDEIVLSVMEHHSNLVPWQLLARRTGATLRFADIDEQGRYGMAGVEAVLSERTRLVSLVARLQRAGHGEPDRRDRASVRTRWARWWWWTAPSRRRTCRWTSPALGCDFYAFSGHKMCGPSGVGGVWGRRALLEAMPPFLGGGDMIDVVDLEGPPGRGCPQVRGGDAEHRGVIGLGAAVGFLEEVGMDAVQAHEDTLMRYAMARLREVPDITLYGPESPDERAGAISFTLADIHPHDLATILDSEGIAIRAGHHCCQPLMRCLGVSSTARASFALYNTPAEIDRLVDALHGARTLFGY